MDDNAPMLDHSAIRAALDTGTTAVTRERTGDIGGVPPNLSPPPITGPQERRDVFGRIIDGLHDPSVSLHTDLPPLGDWIKFSHDVPSLRS